MEENKFYVYIWYYKDTGEVFYVGKGCGNRYKQLSQSRNSYFKNIISSEKENVAVRFYKEHLLEQDAFNIEKELIHFYWQKNECKANFHEGGCGGNTGNYDNPERSRKISEAAKKRIGPLNGMYGKHQSEETKKKLSEINLAKHKVLSPEHKQALIKANTGRVKTEEEKEKLREANLGKKMSPESKQKMLEHLCHFEYQVYLNNELQYSCLGRTALYNYCSTQYNISKGIVLKVINNTWKPTFNKHKFLATLEIKTIERCID